MSYRPANDPLLPQNPDTDYARQLNLRLKDIFRSFASRINGMADGQINSIDNATATVPATGMYAVGDFVRNSTPSELGTAGSKYIVFGWSCVTSTPLAFVQCRFLTGN
jgi:hypothetical protein